MPLSPETRSAITARIDEIRAECERDSPFAETIRLAALSDRSLSPLSFRTRILDRVRYGFGYVAGSLAGMGASRLSNLVYGIALDGPAKSDGYDDAAENAEDRRWREYSAKSESTFLRDLCALLALALFVSGFMAFALLASSSPHAIEAAECAQLAAINGSCSF